MADQINASYGSYSLQTSNIITGDIQHTSTPGKKFFSNPRARTPGVAVSGSQSLDKNITLAGRIIGTSLADLDARIDALKLALAFDGLNLDIDWNGTGNLRRYVANVQAVSLLGRADTPLAEKFKITFSIPDGYGLSANGSGLVTSTLLSTTVSSGAFTSGTFTVGGDFPIQYPIFSLTLTSFTSAVTTNTVAITNPANGMKIYITRAWTAGDVIVMDTNPNSFTLTVNGVAVDYSGSFPWWKPGAGATVGCSDDFSARSIAFLMTNINRWS